MSALSSAAVVIAAAALLVPVAAVGADQAARDSGLAVAGSVSRPASASQPAAGSRLASASGPASVSRPTAASQPAPVSQPTPVPGTASAPGPAAETKLASVSQPASVSRGSPDVPHGWPARAAAAGRASPMLPASAAASAPASAPRGGWAWPLSPRPPVLRPFAIGPHPWSPGHRGVDLGAATGATVLAPAAGQVTFAGVVVDRPVVVITHANGLRTSYEPVTSTVPVGTTVGRGDVVGRLATGGHCAGCLHWGARSGGRYVDPLLLLGPPRVVLLPLGRTG